MTTAATSNKATPNSRVGLLAILRTALIVAVLYTGNPGLHNILMLWVGVLAVAAALVAALYLLAICVGSIDDIRKMRTASGISRTRCKRFLAANDTAHALVFAYLGWWWMAAAILFYSAVIWTDIPPKADANPPETTS